MTPSPNSKYPPDTPIVLYISGGGIKVPDVTNLPLSSAEATLKSVGLTYSVQFQPGPVGENIPPNTVWQQQPTQGTVEQPNSQVTLFVQPQPTSSPTPTTSATPTSTPTATATATATPTGNGSPPAP